MAGPWEKYQQAAPAAGPWARYQAQSEQAPAPAAEERPGMLGFLNQGIAQGLGMPVDMVTALLNTGIEGVNTLTGAEMGTIDEPFGGSASINRAIGGIGAEVAPPDMRPEGVGENLAAGAGGAAGSLLPFAGAARAAQGVGGLAGGAADRILSPFVSTPIRSTAAEVAAGAGAGAGMDVAEKIAPDSPVSPLVGAVVGGLAGGAGPYLAIEGSKRLPGVSLASRFIQRELAPHTEAGAMERARSRLANVVEDPEAAIRGMQQETVSELSPAVSSGDRRLMALERAARDTDPTMDAIMRGEETEAGQTLQRAFREPGQDRTTLDARPTMEGAVEREVEGISRLLDQTFGVPLGVERTSRAVRDVSAPARQEAYGAAYNTPIDYASDAGRNLEGLLGRVERAAPGTINLANRMMAGEGAQSRQILANVAEDGTVTFQQMPDTRQIDYITRALNQMARSGDGAGAMGGQTDVGRIMGNLSREIRDSLREANPNYGQALDTAATPIGQRNALLTGQRLLDRNTPRDVAAEEIAGLTDAELAFVRQGVRSQIDETLANVRQSLSEPDVGMAQARRALRDLSAPAVREKIGLILPEEQAAAFFERIDRAASMLDPRRSGPALFSSARPNEEIRAILNAPDPQAAARQLVAQVDGNTSSTALAGLKGGVLDELMNAARRGGFDEAGNQMLSGRGLRRALEEGRLSGVAREILSPEELERARRIADELSLMETAQGRLPDVGAVMEGEPNSIVSLVARVIAARSGARAGQGAGGASLVTAGYFSRRVQQALNSLTLDRAEELIREAIGGNRELFELLLTQPNAITPQQESRLLDVLTRSAIGATGGGAAASGEDPGDDLTDTIMR